VKRRCGSHRLATDVRLDAGLMCVGQDVVGNKCQRRCMFGVFGGRARHCRQHRQAGEVDLVHKRCEMAGCGKQASCGDAADRVPRCCSQHKRTDHVLVRGAGVSRERKRLAPLARQRSGKRPRAATASGTKVGQVITRSLKTLGEAEAKALVVRIYACRPQDEQRTYLRYGCVRECSARFGVSPKTVRDIWQRVTWVSTTRPYWTEAEGRGETPKRTNQREYSRWSQDRARRRRGCPRRKFAAGSVLTDFQHPPSRPPVSRAEDLTQGQGWSAVHGVHLLAAEGANKPAEHVLQVEDVVAPVAAEYLPAAHPEHDAADSAENLPATHFTQVASDVEACAREYLPAEHEMPDMFGLEADAASPCSRMDSVVSNAGGMDRVPDISAGLSAFCQELPAPFGGLEWSLPSPPQHTWTQLLAPNSLPHSVNAADGVVDSK